MSALEKNIVWLSSYPKSGNTWVRMLLNSIIFGGDFSKGISESLTIKGSDNTKQLLQQFAPDELSSAEFNANRPKYLRALSKKYNDKVLYLKTHTLNATVNDVTQFPSGITLKSVLIIRNPFDVTCSLMNHFGHSEDGALDMLTNKKTFLGESKDNYMVPLSNWEAFNSSWIGTRDKSPLCILRYEDLITRPFSSLQILTDFLKLPATENRIIDAITATRFSEVKRLEQEKGFAEAVPSGVPFFNSGTSGQYRDKLSRESIMKIADRFETILPMVGYIFDKNDLGLRLKPIKHVWPQNESELVSTVNR